MVMNDFTKMSLNVRCLIIAIILSALSYACFPYVDFNDTRTMPIVFIALLSSTTALIFWIVTFARLIHKFLFGRDWDIPK